MKRSSPKLKKLFIFPDGNFPSQKIKKTALKKFLIFREMELLASRLKYFLYFFLKKFCFISVENLQNPERQKKYILKKFLIFLKKNFFSNFGMTVDRAVK